MRHWIAITTCALTLACSSEDKDSRTVSVREMNGDPDASFVGGRPGNTGGVVGGGSQQRDGGGVVASGARLSDLDTEAIAALCADIDELFAEEISDAELDKLSCTFDALFFVDLDRTSGVVIVNETQCQAHVADCLTVTGGSGRLRCETESFRSASEDCEATVDDYEACMTAGARALGDAVDVLTCDNLASTIDSERAFQSGSSIDPLSHAECISIATRCPGLFGDTSRGMPAEDGCDETCGESDDSWCDDGGPDSQTSLCALGTDCLDCGTR